MRRMVTVLAMAVSISLLACGVAAASITLFEPPLFHLGSVNDQSGVGGVPWKSAPPGAIPACVPTPTNGEYDQEVVANSGSDAPPGEPPGFGSQSLRMSNACASGEFFYQTYSPQELQQVGEARPNKVFIAEFAFLPTTPDYQPGLFLSVSPDSGEGSRMSWVGLQDTAAGIQVSVNDTPDVDGEFVAHPGPLLGRSSPHRIRFRVKVNPGPDNDVVRIAVDDRNVGCFTTWENYYRTAPEQAPPPNRNTPATINSLQFRSSVPGPLALLGRGYLFDNVSITPSNGPGPKPCSGGGGGEGPPPVVIDKTTPTQFARPGDLITYRITVRNRGDASVRGLRACDRAPRALRFVRSSTRLRRAAGRRLCLPILLLRPGQRRAFDATFRLRANVTADAVTNSADADAPAGSAPSPIPPEDPPVVRRRRRVARDAATVGVRRPAACPAALIRRARAAC